ncbi:NAD(P)-binding protein [Paenibacillus sp. YN15]|uniref:NAD(P)-binding protein n=1 Tax=Paenibacillus sp. YN15 TaxID=1742774 RepID=UPI000DCB2EA4|nr:NAD(P)/FAD-dependent oxidoreductase [Paenibacillus sp. YN15]RAU92840.1 NAD(P)/FAD-dependent oxidoreductase [Paenibacillus sp. YN15]
MKVAIMGAGLSGLACALTLEKHGITPDIYESRSQVGDRFVNGEIFLGLTAKPAEDCVTYLSNELGIYLHPVYMIRAMSIHGPQETAVMEGRLGHSNIRGRHEKSLEQQLHKQLRSPIRFGSQATYEELLENYTHVVLATGETTIARRLKNYDLSLSVSMKGCTVTGDFDLNTVYTWLNEDYCPKGYGYLIPMSQKEASMVIAYPDYPQFRHPDIHTLWDRFFPRVCSDLQQTLSVIDTFEINHYPIGISRNSRIGNTFFTGNNFGSITPFLGFGQFVSLSTGVYAARDICGLGDYEQLTRPLRRSYANSLVLRKAMEQIGNEQLDTIVKWLGTPIGRKLFTVKHMDVLRAASYLLRPWLGIKSLV